MKRKNDFNILKKLLCWIPLIIVALMFALGACTIRDTGKSQSNVSQSSESTKIAESGTGDKGSPGVEEKGNYTSKDEVALYIHTFGKLPLNYITKNEAKELGWDASAGNLSDVLPGRSIGGSPFGNYEGILPKAEGRKYFECDIDYEGGYRGAKRLVYSNDGLIFYTEDHYNTFEQLY